MVNNNKFYVGLFSDESSGTRRVSYGFSAEAISFDELPLSKEKTKGEIVIDRIESFEGVLKEFDRVMRGMQTSIPLFLVTLPKVKSLLSTDIIESKAKTHGKGMQTKGKAEIFELDMRYYREIVDAFTAFHSMDAFSRFAPGIFLSGLVSIFDDFIGKLIRVMLLAKPEMVEGSNVSISFAQLVELKSIEAARDSVIEKEVESILRSSHADQVKSLERKLGITLRENLGIWPEFIEICERRNLWTHSGGVVSKQYIDVCRGNDVILDGVRVGDRLTVSMEYMERAYDVFLEIGLKLAHTIWRKILPFEIEKADRVLNESGFQLIRVKRYLLASQILKFGVEQKRHSRDLVRRMMIINLANSMKLMGRAEEAKRVLADHDWTAVEEMFRLCVAAVNDDVDDVIRSMRKIGADGGVGAEDYREWPVFRVIREKREFRDTFQELFGVPFEEAEEEVAAIEVDGENKLIN